MRKGRKDSPGSILGTTDWHHTYEPLQPLPSQDAADSAIHGLSKFHRNPTEEAGSDWFVVPGTERQSNLAQTILYRSYSAVVAGAQIAYGGVSSKRSSQPHGETVVPKQTRDESIFDTNSRLVRKVESLTQQLEEANDRADQAERAAEQVQFHPKSNDVADALSSDIMTLKADLSDARSHIFSLQPYRKDLTQEEVGTDFDDLVNGVTHWVSKFADPIIENPNKGDHFASFAARRADPFDRLKSYITKDADILRGCLFLETDVDILIAVVMRFLNEQIFETVLFGAVSNTVAALNYVEMTMQTRVEPKRDLFATRTWKAEALNAVICSSEYKAMRGIRLKEVTYDLAKIFIGFIGEAEEEKQKFYNSCYELVVLPAVQLHEKLLISTHHFYMDINQYSMWYSGHSEHGSMTTPEFLEDLHKLRCENIVEYRKPFDIAKMPFRPTIEHLNRDLIHVMTVVPAICMRRIGGGSCIREAEVVRKQQVLVAWGSQEKLNRFMDENYGRTLMYRICFPRSEKQERRKSESFFIHVKNSLQPWVN
ncbi:hypothetical protein B0T17DRAFT_482205 [Bombardia bombarda]|uniref:Uncharacterized protein n=1 Tax=Bombardia bombarda TaxID=252184 RepID=A0AA39XJV1_9PEZI|nr:hypothetical protein B0T17DRAFT_482205 [Bombardia bombarda]